MAFLKPAFTLLLALAFQLVQVIPTAAMSAPCQVSACCCKGTQACACAKEGKPAPQPLPDNLGSTLKVPTMSPVDTRVRLAPPTRDANLPVSMGTAPLTGLSPGYHGISLAVAFCSFVM